MVRLGTFFASYLRLMIPWYELSSFSGSTIERGIAEAAFGVLMFTFLIAHFTAHHTFSAVSTAFFVIHGVFLASLTTFWYFFARFDIHDVLFHTVVARSLCHFGEPRTSIPRNILSGVD